MLIAARNGFMAGGESILPPGARWVEYLESTGTQWIDTGVYFREKARVVARLILANNQDRDIIGTPSTSEGSFILNFGGSVRRTLYYKYGGKAKNVDMDRMQDLLLDIDASDTVIINGDTYIYPSDVSGWTFNFATQILSLFKGRTYDTGCIYFVRLYDGATLVRDFIPVRFTNEQGISEGAMYDKRGVGGMDPDGSARDDGLYRNRGTGAFAIGPDKAASNGGGGYKRKCVRRSYRRSLRPSARFYWRCLWKEVA